VKRPREAGPLYRPEGVIANMAEQGRRTMAMEHIKAHLARADGEFEAALRFLDLTSNDEAEIGLVRAVAKARTCIGDALETIRARLWEPG
jgi:hypothetical protein